jgi:hypothetical protein
MNDYERKKKYIVDKANNRSPEFIKKYAKMSPAERHRAAIESLNEIADEDVFLTVDILIQTLEGNNFLTEIIQILREVIEKYTIENDAELILKLRSVISELTEKIFAESLAEEAEIEASSQRH